VRGDASLSVVWSSDSIVSVPPGARRAVVVNGTTSTRLSVRLDAAARVQVVDHLGADIATGELPVGTSELQVPVGGRAHLSVG